MAYGNEVKAVMAINTVVASVDKYQKKSPLACIIHSKWRISTTYSCGVGCDDGDDVGFSD